METTKILGCGIGCLSLACFASGIIWLGVAIVWWQQNHSFVQTAQRVEGEVIEVRESRHDGNTQYSPVVEFIDHIGQQQKFQSRVSSSPQRYFVGDKVQILYDKDNPKSAAIDNWWEINLFQLIPLSFGIVSFFVSIILAFVAFFVYRQRRKDNVGSNTVPVPP